MIYKSTLQNIFTNYLAGLVSFETWCLRIDALYDKYKFVPSERPEQTLAFSEQMGVKATLFQPLVVDGITTAFPVEYLQHLPVFAGKDKNIAAVWRHPSLAYFPAKTVHAHAHIGGGVPDIHSVIFIETKHAAKVRTRKSVYNTAYFGCLRSLYCSELS